MTDLKVSAALASVLVAETIAALLWAGSAAERIDQLEQKADRSYELMERTARLEEQALHIRTTVIRIERKIDGDQARGH